VEELNANLARVPHSRVDYACGQTVRSQGEPYEELLVLLSGEVAADFRTPDGRLLRVETLEAPETVASAFLFSPEGRLPVELTAESTVRAFRIGRDGLLRVASACPSVFHALLEDISQRSEFLASKLRMVQFETLRERIAHYLLEQMGRQDTATVHLPVAKKKLAAIVGSARQSVFRCLGELEEEGVLQQEGRSIRVCRPDRLRALATKSE
jgi:CRP-like cAMP-binding protein